MKPLCFSIALCATLAAGSASAADPWATQSIDHSPRIMLYIHKYIGTKDRKLSAPSFGLGIDRQVGFSQGDSLLPLQSRSIRVFDFRLSGFNRSSMRINGLNFDSGGPNGEGSYGETSYSNESWQDWRFLLAVGVGAVGVACLTHNVICKEDEPPAPPPPPPPTTTPPPTTG